MITARHRFHSICPYFAMFPEAFVEKHLAASRFDGVVFDPFCGRGTSIFQALLQGRVAAGSDVNAVALCITGAKADPPKGEEALRRLRELENTMPTDYCPPANWAGGLNDFFSLCFHEKTLRQVLYLREKLEWRTRGEDRFLAAVCLGALHGESHKSPNYLSNRMPRTISTKPDYSVRWWIDKGCLPPERDAFEVIRRMVVYRYGSPLPKTKGKVCESDARKCFNVFPELEGQVTDVITSPPYLDTTNYMEDQWLRLWFLGGEPLVHHERRDSRHYDPELYWNFLTESWQGMAPLLGSVVRMVIRIGGRRLAKDVIKDRLIDSLTSGLQRNVHLQDDGLTTLIRSTQANSFRGERASQTVEHDFCLTVA